MTSDHAATVQRFYDTWAKRDPDGLCAFFAEDGQWWEPHREPAVGQAELRTGFELQTAFVTDFNFEMKLLAQVGDDVVVTERTDSWVLNEMPMAVDVMGIFNFNADGLISRYRDYYDWGVLERQLVAAGISLEEISEF